MQILGHRCGAVQKFGFGGSHHLTGNFHPGEEGPPKAFQLRIGFRQNPHDFLDLPSELHLILQLLLDIGRRRWPGAHGELVHAFGSPLELQDTGQIPLFLNMAHLYFSSEGFIGSFQVAIVLHSLLDGLLKLLQIALSFCDLVLCLSIGLGTKLQIVAQRLQLALHVGRVRRLFALFGLGLELQGDDVALVNGALHLDDHLLLAPFQLLQSQLHAMNLLLHCSSICLSDVRIQSCLHLFL
mmetsp:Transcript_35754/g.77232  ORF Transcript_35754/g.77232 Transcript_35754/m.77232 type:complete len:240 (-) Transcript_35754:2023-2742(-)